VDAGRLDLEDVGQAIADELEHLLAIERSALDKGFGRHAMYSCFGPERPAV
jgi:hypothetical protein